uniref:Uncharacterized protein n=1 Tax=Rhipicephalus microplus TaxID=6941 RepID=A0A6G5A2L3_RHIMP
MKVLKNLHCLPSRRLFCMLREACALPVVIHVTCLVFRRYIYIIQLDRNCLVDGLMGFFQFDVLREQHTKHGRIWCKALLSCTLCPLHCRIGNHCKCTLQVAKKS